MNTNQTARIIAVLTEVLNTTLWDGISPETYHNSTFTCNAASIASRNLYGPEAYYSPEVTEIKDSIGSYMGDEFTYEGVFAKQHKITGDVFAQTEERRVEIQAGRKAMVEALIASYQAKLQVEILTLASTRVWDGVSSDDEGPTNSEYMCIAITNAAVDVLFLGHLDGDHTYAVSSSAANKVPAVIALHEDISKMIHGFGTARGYYKHKCVMAGNGFSDIALQAFRKSHLESMAASYAAKVA